jgi:hypothetical protein
MKEKQRGYYYFFQGERERELIKSIRWEVLGVTDVAHVAWQPASEWKT